MHKCRTTNKKLILTLLGYVILLSYTTFTIQNPTTQVNTITMLPGKLSHLITNFIDPCSNRNEFNWMYCGETCDSEMNEDMNFNIGFNIYSVK